MEQAPSGDLRQHRRLAPHFRTLVRLKVLTVLTVPKSS
jgi:hypothetical protein